MNITPNERTIREYALTLSDIDADLALNDPFSFGEKVREALLPHLPVSVPVRHKPTAAQHITIGKNGKGKRAAKGPKAAAGAKRPKVTCPECGKSIAAKFLPRHLETKHATAPAAASSSSPE